MNESRLMTVKAVAKYLGIPVKTTYALLDHTGFPSIRVSPHRILISRMALDEWLFTGGLIPADQGKVVLFPQNKEV